jgi:hypothetical protein
MPRPRLLTLVIASVLTAVAAGCATPVGGSEGAAGPSVVPTPMESPSAVTAPLIPAASVLPTTLPTTVPTPAATPTKAPPPKPEPKPTIPPTPVAGKFTVVETVTKSNRATVPVGHQDKFTWTLTVLCDPTCAAIPPGGDVSVKGRTWTYSFTSEIVCYRLNSAGKKYDKKKGSTTSKTVLKFSRPTKTKPQTFAGTVKQRLKKECPGYRGEFAPWSVDYKLKGTFAGVRK